MRDHEVDRRPHVVLVEGRVGHAELLGHDERVGRLVELTPERVGGDPPIEEAVTWHRPVGLLLPVEKEGDRIPRGLQVAIRHQAGPRLVEVAREDLAVRAEEEIVRVAGGHRLAPG